MRGVEVWRGGGGEGWGYIYVERCGGNMEELTG